MFRQLGPLEIGLILLLVVLLFGARKLPETAKGMGQALRIFKKEVREDAEESAAAKQVEAPKAIAPVPPTPVSPPPVTGATVQEPERQER
jgi:sec-independent protein translocase protein TatA